MQHRGLLDHPLRRIEGYRMAQSLGNPNTKPETWTVTLSCGHTITMTTADWIRDGRGKWLDRRSFVRCEDCPRVDR